MTSHQTTANRSAVDRRKPGRGPRAGSAARKVSVSALVPMYNEEATIESVLRQLLRVREISEVVVVDDGSTDRSAELVEAMGSRKIRLIRQANGGKTAAIRAAIAAAKGDVLIVQDADLEYDPAEIPAVLEPILLGKADVVYGSRFLVRKTARVLYFYHYLANRFLTFLSNCFTNINMTDVETGYKALRSPILRHMDLTSSGFGMELEITARIARLPVRIYEVPISYYGRTYEEGKKIGMKDGLMAIYYIFYYNLLFPLTGRSRLYREQVMSVLAPELPQGSRGAFRTGISPDLPESG